MYDQLRILEKMILDIKNSISLSVLNLAASNSILLATLKSLQH